MIDLRTDSFLCNNRANIVLNIL